MKKLLVFVFLMILLSACDQAIEVTEGPVRAVKTLVISEASKTNSRQISGVVKTANESDLSFRVSGRVNSVEVKAGDTVSSGQVLAKLEQKEYQLAIDSTRSDLASMRANFNEKKAALKRQTTLKKRDLVSQSAVDQARAMYEAARSSVNVAKTTLKNVENDLDYTILRAPFSGKIAERSVDPFVEITAGKTVFQLQSEGGFKVEVLMPETLIRDVSHGDIVSVRFPTLKEIVIGGTITEIGAKAESGNAFPVKIDLAQTPSDVRSGMTAIVTFNYGEAGDKAVYLIPITALDLRVPETVIDNPEKQAKVFVFNPKEQTAEKRMVSIRDVRGNEFEVIEGLNSGDILIIAGVPFLTEGQKVIQWEPHYNIPAKLNYEQ